MKKLRILLTRLLLADLIATLVFFGLTRFVDQTSDIADGAGVVFYSDSPREVDARIEKGIALLKARKWPSARSANRAMAHVFRRMSHLATRFQVFRTCRRNLDLWARSSWSLFPTACTLCAQKQSTIPSLKTARLHGQRVQDPASIPLISGSGRITKRRLGCSISYRNPGATKFWIACVVRTLTPRYPYFIAGIAFGTANCRMIFMTTRRLMYYLQYFIPKINF